MPTDSAIFELEDSVLVERVGNMLFDIKWSLAPIAESIIDRYNTRGYLSHKEHYFLSLCLHNYMPIETLGYFPDYAPNN